MRPIPVLAAFLTLAITYFVGVVFFFAPIAEAEVLGDPLVPQVVAFLVSTVLYIGLFVWTAEQTRSALKAAFIIAASQFLLVNVDYLLSGKRTLAVAAASTVLLAVSWTAVGLVYRTLRGSIGESTSPGAPS